ncbi:DUF1896 family protein [Parabacteroides sp. PF5-9]|uniref:DUF1896 family protein n=1 Tax=Parabacteroides sp. PF5-9 TaxID=1742404 RepID=UPI0024772BEE|nr:DUF1896 family protein [Parabacteroides sp. PF5-9]MDH6358908.1 hypothetical protein [Parabacteroides sp. PF5-9]
MEGLDKANVFQQEIYSYLKDYFPNLFEDIDEVNEIIVTRAKAAKAAFEKADNEGYSTLEALEKANEALHQGFEFSPIAYIKTFYEEVKDEIIDNDEACKILKKAGDLFWRYGADFEGTEEEYELRNELMAFI